MIVAGQYRLVNHVTYTGPGPLIFVPPGVNITYSYEAYYDKITGLIVKGIITFMGASYIETLTSTTAFNTLPPLNPEEQAIALPFITAAIAIVPLTLVAVAITQHRKQKTRRN
jgi:hypothetical protein